MTLIYALIASILCSLLSLIGIILLGLKDRILKKILLILVAFSSGTLFGSAFLHLIPEALEKGNDVVFIYVIGGICLFFLVEKLLQWRHCHDIDCQVHSFAYINLFGDGLHNFLDGVIIASAFISSVPLGVTTTLAVIYHEIPQEMGDFGVLLHGGFTKTQALMYNFLSASFSLLGVLVTYFFAILLFKGIVSIILPLAAGGFIYLAGSDLIPQLHNRRSNPGESLFQLFYILTGVSLMWGIKTLSILH